MSALKKILLPFVSIGLLVDVNDSLLASAFQTNQPVASPNFPKAGLDNLIAWDSEAQATTAETGAGEAHLTFIFTNVSPSNVTITDVHTSCGCTTAQLPALPWSIQSGTNGQIRVTVNLAGKSGTLFKTVTLNTDKGSKVLFVKVGILPPLVPVASTTNQSTHLQATSQKQSAGVAIPPVNQTSDLPAAQAVIDPNRSRSFQMAKVDRQAVFHGDCASCHVKAVEGKYAKQLYDEVCGVCHEAAHRASMVPDLHRLTVSTDENFWRTWISYGRPGSLMPAFAKTETGPFTDMQIVSLAAYLNMAIPSHITNSIQ